MDEVTAALGNLLDWLPTDEQLDRLSERKTMIPAKVHVDDVRAARAALAAAEAGARPVGFATAARYAKAVAADSRSGAKGVSR